MKRELILILLLLAVAICNAQTKPTAKQVDSIRAVVAQELLVETPAWITCFSTKRSPASLFVIAGYIKAGIALDSKHKPLPSWITVVSLVERKPAQPFKKRSLKKP